METMLLMDSILWFAVGGTTEKLHCQGYGFIWDKVAILSFPDGIDDPHALL